MKFVLLNKLEHMDRAELIQNLRELYSTVNAQQKSILEYALIINYILYERDGELILDRALIDKRTPKAFVVDGSSCIREIVVRWATPAECASIVEGD